jgi:large subunit ribosomal protein L23
MKDYNIIIGPVDTEKTNIAREELNQVAFEVAPSANRVQIRKAVESIFNVEVSSVRTMRVRGKFKRRGKIRR